MYLNELLVLFYQFFQNKDQNFNCMINFFGPNPFASVAKLITRSPPNLTITGSNPRKTGSGTWKMDFFKNGSMKDFQNTPF